jgi:NADP-dependent 3-hydroxy acid dehydrogenase YdfG
MARLAGKVVLITGASSGIGYACAKEFAKHNTTLILAARRLDRITALKQEIESTYPSVNVHTLELDVRDRKKVCFTLYYNS